MSVVVSWYSCGAASAVSSAIVTALPIEVVVARCLVANEHADNDRFAADCARWYGQPVINLKSEEYADCWDVWEKRKFIAGIHGAPCTIEMKKVPRWAFERENEISHHVFGFTYEEQKRADRFREQNPEVTLWTPLIDNKLTKADCFQLVEGAGIKRPVMYDLGFSNNNCICCGKATSIVYWARCRHYFPEQFNRMSDLSRRLGARLTRLKGKRIFLDEIPADIRWDKRDRENVECGILCVGEK